MAFAKSAALKGKWSWFLIYARRYAYEKRSFTYKKYQSERRKEEYIRANQSTRGQCLFIRFTHWFFFWLCLHTFTWTLSLDVTRSISFEISHCHFLLTSTIRRFLTPVTDSPGLHFHNIDQTHQGRRIFLGDNAVLLSSPFTFWGYYIVSCLLRSQCTPSCMQYNKKKPEKRLYIWFICVIDSL